MGDFAKGIKAFKAGMKEEDEAEAPPPAQVPPPGATTGVGATTGAAAATANAAAAPASVADRPREHV
jgi:sec-independent protein translocase protein TatA